MAYKMITRTREDGSTETYKEYHRSRVIASLLGFFLGGIGLHFLYARNFTYFWIMVILFGSVVYYVPYESPWAYLPAVIGLVTSFYYLFMSEEKFFKAINGYS